MSLDYPTSYYAKLCSGSSASAKAVVPLVIDLLFPRSVIDLGCGSGAWLAEFKRQGVMDVLGVDGSHITAGQLQIEPGELVASDLSQPLHIHRRFDLAVSLEVAEHLAEHHSGQLIDTLTMLSDAVLFSAAIPHQGGEHHVNEQWPAYWAERFDDRDYAAFDPFRRLLWERPDVEWWYAQNLLLYVHRKSIPKYPQLLNELQLGKSVPAIVHPECFLHLAWRNRVLEAILELVQVTPAGARIVVVDQDLLGHWPCVDRQILPFSERGGIYHGPPRDSEEALRELQHQQNSGASYIAFAWPAFWWLDHYMDFSGSLRNRFPEILHTGNWVVFSLEGATAPDTS